MSQVRWAVLLALATLATGCLGGVTPAKISQSTLDNNGWSQTNRQEQGVALGLGQLVQRDYRPSGSPPGTGAVVASTNDVPILDESRFIPQALERVEQERNIDLQESGTTTVSLPELGGQQVEAQLYTFQKSGATGKAILLKPDQCDPFVVAVGYGITGGGGVGIQKTYNEAKRVVRGVVCG